MKAILIEPYTGMRVMVRGVLKAFGITELHEPRTSLEALKILMDKPVDFFICSEHIVPYDATLCHKLFRAALEDEIRTTRSLVMMEEGNDQLKKRLVDVGCDEILLKPYSADDIVARLKRLIRNRGAFIETKAYVGPDRRKDDVDFKDDEMRSDLTNPGRAEFKYTMRQLLGRLFKLEADLIEKKKKEREGERLKPGVFIEESGDDHEDQVTLEGLRIGLVLTRPVKANSGMLVLPADVSLKRKSISRLEDMVNMGQVEDRFFVREIQVE
ncbi:hypothetical protein RYZ26_08470 [Terasakiella sp. A23]|uniref:hypothetical protein n=1 Tax=Terasakiella sp. FCG-A23 TaxID=3080561 RepID=UPI002952A91E|nr:hypothetical protein [Terasakiella sp. A23]MDV7339623.1 hypothetical protein [Terasakiella sp. A23]